MVKEKEQTILTEKGRYLVYVPALEIEVDATDEIDAYDKAIAQISYADLHASLILGGN